MADFKTDINAANAANVTNATNVTNVTKISGRLRLKKASLGGIGIPTLIIAVFWLITLVGGHIVGISVMTLLSDTIKRVGMNGVLVLAMVPAIQSGTGPNFALPVGIVCGLFALVCAIELDLTGVSWLLASVLMSVPLAVIAGYIYGKLLNAVKGSEMTIATYTGFSICALMCLVWLTVPFSNPKMGWFIGDGLRETIQLDAVQGSQVLNKFLALNIGGDVVIPISASGDLTVIHTDVDGKKDTVSMEDVRIPSVKKMGIIFAFDAGDVAMPTVIGGSGMTVVNTGESEIPSFKIGDAVIPALKAGDGVTVTEDGKVTDAVKTEGETEPVVKGGVFIPTGMLLAFGFFAVLVRLFFRSKTGIAISAGGINPKFAQAAGLNIDRSRIWANVLSTMLGAIGIIIYSQSFGYAQLYTAPLMMAFPAVAAVLIGGATASRASVFNVIIGTVLFQGLLTTALPVANEVFRGTDLSEIMRMIIQNGIILYALTQVKRGG